MKLNEALKNRREKLGMSQAELARRLGTAKAFISDTERGKRPITYKHLLRVSATLQFPKKVEDGLIAMLKRDIKAEQKGKL